jgi:hypothetical protein
MTDSYHVVAAVTKRVLRRMHEARRGTAAASEADDPIAG